MPDQIIVRFRSHRAALLHAQRLATRAGRRASQWAEVAAQTGLDDMPPEITQIRPFVSGAAKAQALAMRNRGVAAALSRGVPFTADQTAVVSSSVAQAAVDHGPIGLFSMKLKRGSDLRKVCLELMKHKDVIYAHPSPLCRPAAAPNDPLYSRMWNLDRIGMRDAWDLSGNTLGMIRVCVVDTGIRISHTELAGRIADPKDVYPDNGDAYADADPDNDDPHGHGTACAGIIASIRDNSTLVAGIAPVTIIPVNGAVEIQGDYAIANYTDGVFWGVDHGADVISLSIGRHSYGYGPYQAELDAADYAEMNEVLVCAAAGNDDGDADDFYPSAIPYYISVGAIDDDDLRVTQPKWWWGSNFGDTLDITAPGQGDVGIYGDSILTLWAASDNDYINYFNGTSTATPHVAALCALIKHVNPSLDAAGIRDILQSTAEDQIGDPSEDLPGWDPYHGHGLIDAAAAIAAALEAEGQTFTIFNDGTGMLTVSSIDLDSSAPWLSWSPSAPFDIGPDSSQPVMVSVDYNQAPEGVTTSQLLIYSNDPDESPYPDGVYITVINGTAMELLITEITPQSGPQDSYIMVEGQYFGGAPGNIYFDATAAEIMDWNDN
ncbi:MAG: S8 family serine peptidase, partial [Gammaproteobacteria bacterium]|nr:S8 family serine peptidase [Gammaproteobacteria bacterium]